MPRHSEPPPAPDGGPFDHDRDCGPAAPVDPGESCQRRSEPRPRRRDRQRALRGRGGRRADRAGATCRPGRDRGGSPRRRPVHRHGATLPAPDRPRGSAPAPRQWAGRPGLHRAPRNWVTMPRDATPARTLSCSPEGSPEVSGPAPVVGWSVAVGHAAANGSGVTVLEDSVVVRRGQARASSAQPRGGQVPPGPVRPGRRNGGSPGAARPTAVPGGPPESRGRQARHVNQRRLDPSGDAWRTPPPASRPDGAGRPGVGSTMAPWAGRRPR